MSKLAIIETSVVPSSGQRVSSRHIQEALFERRWHQNPEQFDPARSARTSIEAQRLLDKLPLKAGKRALDLGTGYGHIAKKLYEAGMYVDALDISLNALRRLNNQQVNLIQDYFPYTKLEDGAYDLVVANNLIAELPEVERRLAVSEINRLLKLSGIAIISTPIDIYSEDALIRFIKLLETEFDIDELTLSHHALAIRLPLFPHSKKILNLLESVGRFIWQDGAISHVIASVRPRPLTSYSSPVEERKTKKSVWE